MLDALMELLRTPPPATADTVGAPFPRRELAVAVLLLEVAQCDRGVGPEETAVIERIVRERMQLDPATANALIDAARTEFEAALDDWIFAAAIREGFDAAERIAIVAQLWQLVYSDRQLERLEEATMQRLAGEVGIDASDLEAARAQAFARNGRAVREGERE